MFPAARPLLEPDRFFAAPRGQARHHGVDAQRRAVERLVQRCAQMLPHLQSVDALDQFIRRQPNPARTRRRISLALAIELPDSEPIYGTLGRRELEAFRAIAQTRPAAVIWVFA